MLARGPCPLELVIAGTSPIEKSGVFTFCKGPGRYGRSYARAGPPFRDLGEGGAGRGGSGQPPQNGDVGRASNGRVTSFLTSTAAVLKQLEEHSSRAPLLKCPV